VDNSNLDKNYFKWMYHEEGSLIFKLEHLDRYAIVKEPCTLIVKNNSSLQWMIFTQKTTVPVDPKSKVISEFNLILKELSKKESA
jgi:hypothetical protein